MPMKNGWRGGLRASLGREPKPPHVDLSLTLTSLRDVVGRLHAHESVHFYAEGFLDA